MEKLIFIIAFIVLYSFGFSLFAFINSKATVLYFNDAHEISPVVDRLGERGGVARIKTIVDEVKTENPETIVIFGGDLGGGTLFGAVYHGFPIVEAFNLIPVNIANFGQHDFDFGSEETQKLFRASNFQWISSNLVDSNNKPFANVPTFKIMYVDKLAIGFLGLTDAMNTTTREGKVYQNDLIESAKRVVEKLKQRRVDVIMAVTQTGQKVNEKLLEDIPEIDAIFSEEMYENRTNIYYVGKRPIITTCGNLGSVARLDIHKVGDIASFYIRVYSVDSTVVEEVEMAKLQKKYQQKMERDLSKPVATLLSTLDAGINQDFACRWRETNVGNLITDSYREFYKADIAFLNGGGIRANIPKGKFTVKDALSILPFGNTICLIETSGKHILNALEYGVSSVQELGGQFLQISGANYEYDWSKDIGKRITTVSVDGVPLDMNKLYTVALPNYILFGGNGFSLLEHSKILVPPASGRKDIEIFVEYCHAMNLIDAKIEGRIIVKNKK